MKADFSRSINQIQSNLSRLMKAELFDTWVGTPDKPGKWNACVSRTTFYDWVNANFSTVSPRQAPYLTERHIAQRLEWATNTLQRIEAEGETFLPRIIFMDGAIFSKKTKNLYEPEKLRLVASRDPKKRPPLTYSHLPVSRSFEVYEGITLGDTTGPFIFAEWTHLGKDSKPNSQIVEFFAQNYLHPLADRMRGNLGLEPTDALYVIFDGAMVHKSKLFREALAAANIVSLDFPCRAPELNVIETLWARYKRILRRREFKDNTPEAFLKELRGAIAEVTQEKVDGLVQSFEGRLRKMVQVKGNSFYWRDPELPVEDEDDEVPDA